MWRERLTCNLGERDAAAVVRAGNEVSFFCRECAADQPAFPVRGREIFLTKFPVSDPPLPRSACLDVRAPPGHPAVRGKGRLSARLIPGAKPVKRFTGQSCRQLTF